MAAALSETRSAFSASATVIFSRAATVDDDEADAAGDAAGLALCAVPFAVAFLRVLLAVRTAT